MKQQFSAFVKSIWDYTNTNVGAVLLGSGITYLFTQGTNEKRIARLEEDLSEASTENAALVKSVTNLQTKYADTIKDLVNSNNMLQDCRISDASTRYAYHNSICLFRHKIPPQNDALNITHPKKLS